MVKTWVRQEERKEERSPPSRKEVDVIYGNFGKAKLGDWITGQKWSI